MSKMCFSVIILSKFYFVKSLKMKKTTALLSLFSLIVSGCNESEKKDEQTSKVSETEVAKEEVKKQASPEEKISLPGYADLNPDTIVGEYNNKKVHLRDVVDNLTKVPASVLEKNFEEIYKDFVKVFIKMDLIKEKVTQEKLRENPQIKELIKNLEKMIMQKFLMKEMTKDKINEDEVKQKYEEFIKVFPKQHEVKYEYIVFNTLDEANKALKDEEALKEKMKKDSNKADLTPPSKLPFAREFVGKVNAAKENEILKEALKMKDGKFAIINVLEKKELPLPFKFEDMREKIVNTFFVPKVMLAIISDLAKKYGVKKFDPLGKELNDKNKQELEKIDVKSIKEETVVVEFGDQKIKWRDLIAKTGGEEKNIKAILTAESYPQILDGLISEPLLVKEGEEQGVQNNPEFVKELNKTIDAVTNKIYLDNQVKVEEIEIKKQYDKIIANLPKNQKEIRLKWIVLETEKEANDLLKELKGKDGSKFGELAKKHSLDTVTKDKSGDLGYKVSEEVGNKELWDKLLKQAKGTVLQSVEKISGKFVVFRVEDKRDKPVPKLNELSESIMEQLKPEKIRKFIEAIYKKVVVKIFDPRGEKELKDEPKAEKKEEKKVEDDKKEEKKVEEDKKEKSAA